MGSTFEKLPLQLHEAFAFYLEPSEILSIALASKLLCSYYLGQQLWKSKTNAEYGDLFRIYNILTKAAGLELTSNLKEKYSSEPLDWKEHYRIKTSKLAKADVDALADRAEHEFLQAQRFLKTFENDADVAVLNEVASKMMDILDMFPDHPGCYYILGFILFVLNRLEEATVLLKMGRTIDPGFEPFNELEEEIERILRGYKGEQDEVPLLDDEMLSEQLKEVLLEIFDKFDQDKDGALKPEELSDFIFTTNGSHPPAPFLRQMGQRFGSNSRGWLSRDGFLAFYLEQTLDDPSETRNDLNVHGYDSHSLRKRMEE